ncbi:MAG: DNA repair protein RecO [Patescibacteria group bacterium]
MENTRTTAALILNRQPYREADSLVTVYSPSAGKLSLVARGTQKPGSKLAGHLEPLTLSDIMIVAGKGFDYLAGASGRKFYQGIRNDLNKLYYAGQALRILNQRVGENQAEECLFFLLADWLNALECLAGFRAEQGDLFLSFFIWRLLVELGYQPEIYRCLDCHKPIEPGLNYFHLLKGGLICPDCFLADQKRPDFNSNYLLTVSDNCVKMIRFILGYSLAEITKVRIDKKTNKEIIDLARRFLDYNF